MLLEVELGQDLSSVGFNLKKENNKGTRTLSQLTLCPAPPLRMRDHAGRGDSPAGVLAPPHSAHAPPRGDSHWLRCVEGRGRGGAVRLPAERARSPAAAAVAAQLPSAPRSLRRRLCQRHRVPAALCLLTARRSLVFVLTDF